MEWIRRIPIAIFSFALLGNVLQAQEAIPDLPPMKAMVSVPILPDPLRCEGSCGFYTGASLYLLKPYFSNSNTAYITNTGFGGTSPTQTTTDFSWDYSASPAIWLGWTSENGLGIRGRFFYFNQNSQTATTSLTANQAFNGGVTIDGPNGLPAPASASSSSFGSPGALFVSTNGLASDVLTFTSSLRILTADLEATWMGRSGNWSWVLGGGGRYLTLAQNYQGTLTNNISAAQGGPANETTTLATGHNFNGFGPTINFCGNYRVLNTGLSLYGDVRGSFLVGSTSQFTNFNRVIIDPNGIGTGTVPPQGYSVSSNRDMTMPVLEIELGVAYTFMLGRVQSVISAGAVNQTYFDAGSASQTSGNLSLFGGRFSLGLQF